MAVACLPARRHPKFVADRDGKLRRVIGLESLRLCERQGIHIINDDSVAVLVPRCRFVKLQHVAGGVIIGISPLGFGQICRRPNREFPLLTRAAAETGGVATQNRGTLGGNIANASPAADSPPQ